jgi:hypothetical protein
MMDVLMWILLILILFLIIIMVLIVLMKPPTGRGGDKFYESVLEVRDERERELRDQIVMHTKAVVKLLDDCGRLRREIWQRDALLDEIEAMATEALDVGLIAAHVKRERPAR